MFYTLHIILFNLGCSLIVPHQNFCKQTYHRKRTESELELFNYIVDLV